MGDALALLGFYFTLIGFISGLFFTRLDSWYGSVRQFSGKLSGYRKADDFRNARPEADGLAASAPKGSFAAVGVLLVGLMLLGAFVPVGNSAVDPKWFLYLPMGVVVVAYLLGGGYLLREGGRLLTEARTHIERGLSGEAK